jgi:hypothetical protein
MNAVLEKNINERGAWRYFVHVLQI